MNFSYPVKVLIVDDNEDFCEVTAEILMAAGYSVVVTKEPMAALDAVEKFRPDVCLLDIGLPGMDGYDLARRMRGCLPGLHIVGISGGLHEPEREIEAGAVLQEFIGKPFNYEALVAALGNAERPTQQMPASN